MKLLFDENLSPRLIAVLADLYPDSTHVRLCGLKSAVDEDVWEYAGKNEFTVVSKDADFAAISVLRGAPPKLIWLRIGNCTTSRAASVLRSQHLRITNFLADRRQTSIHLISARKAISVRRVRS